MTDGERILTRANPYRYADESLRQKLKEQQNLKSRAAWEMYQRNFGKTPLSQESNGELQATRARILHMLMESAVDPDFRDEEFAREILAALDIPEESERYGTPNNILTLRESRLRRYESSRANCIEPPGGGWGCMDLQKLRDFMEGRAQNIQHKDGEINYQKFREASEGATIKIDTSLRGLGGFIRESRYCTIHDKPVAVEEWERANIGYYGRRIRNENTLGIRAKGTEGDEHVISGYLFIPNSEFKPLPGQYGDYTLILKKNILNRAGYTQGDAFRTVDNPEKRRMNADTAVLYALTPKRRPDDYIEAQIYGELTLEDVEDINLDLRLGGRFMSAAEKIEKILDFFDEISLEGTARLAERMPNFCQQVINLSKNLERLAEELEEDIKDLKGIEEDRDEEDVDKLTSFKKAANRYKPIAENIVKLGQQLLKEPKAA